MNRTLHRFALLVLTLLVFVARADDAVDQKGPAQTNDLLNIAVTGLIGPGLKTSFKKRVDGNGEISMPLIGKIDVNGKKLADVQDAVNNAYNKAQLIRAAAAQVTREEVAANASIKCGVIAKGDHLEFRIWDLKGPQQETAEVMEVDEKGEINLPIAGKINLVGKDEADAEKAIQKIYRDKQLLAAAMVCVRRISENEAKEQGEK